MVYGAVWSGFCPSLFTGQDTSLSGQKNLEARFDFDTRGGDHLTKRDTSKTVSTS